LATLSSRSDHRVVEGVDHAAMVADDTGAAATGGAILDVVSSVRAGRTPDGCEAGAWACSRKAPARTGGRGTSDAAGGGWAGCDNNDAVDKTSNRLRAALGVPPAALSRHHAYRSSAVALQPDAVSL
jgi:hypothetical protein